MRDKYETIARKRRRQCRKNHRGNFSCHVSMSVMTRRRTSTLFAECQRGRPMKIPTPASFRCVLHCVILDYFTIFEVKQKCKKILRAVRETVLWLGTE